MIMIYRIVVNTSDSSWYSEKAQKPAARFFVQSSSTPISCVVHADVPLRWLPMERRWTYQRRLNRPFPWRIHGAAIVMVCHGSHQYTPFMLAYIPAPWILWDWRMFNSSSRAVPFLFQLIPSQFSVSGFRTKNGLARLLESFLCLQLWKHRTIESWQKKEPFPVNASPGLIKPCWLGGGNRKLLKPL
jgi:hypothetical protein